MACDAGAGCTCPITELDEPPAPATCGCAAGCECSSAGDCERCAGELVLHNHQCVTGCPAGHTAAAAAADPGGQPECQPEAAPTAPRPPPPVECTSTWTAATVAVANPGFDGNAAGHWVVGAGRAGVTSTDGASPDLPENVGWASTGVLLHTTAQIASPGSRYALGITIGTAEGYAAGGYADPDPRGCMRLAI